MRCPFCQFPDNRVLESRSAESGHSVRRRRECLRCGRRFTTYERIEFVPIVVAKRSGERESFDRSKLLRGMTHACEKTGIQPMQLESIVDEIEAELQQRSVREVASNDIGELVLKHLQALNEVAYIRFASVYKQFRGIRDFMDILNHLQAEGGPASDETRSSETRTSETRSEPHSPEPASSESHSPEPELDRSPSSFSSIG